MTTKYELAEVLYDELIVIVPMSDDWTDEDYFDPSEEDWVDLFGPQWE